jgi:hypothetical protein
MGWRKAIPHPATCIQTVVRRYSVNPEGPKNDVFQGAKADVSRKPAAGYNIAGSLYNIVGPTFVERIGSFLDGYGSSLRSRTLKPHKKNQRTLASN